MILPTARSSGIFLFAKASLRMRVGMLVSRRVTQEMLIIRSLESKSEYVFANQFGKPYLVTSLDHIDKKLRSDLQLPNDCVIHSLRHTFLTRFGEAGADAFTIKKWPVIAVKRFQNALFTPSQKGKNGRSSVSRT